MLDNLDGCGCDASSLFTIATIIQESVNLVRVLVIYIITCTAILLLSALGVTLGSANIPFSESLRLLITPWNWGGSQSQHIILFQLRLPRVLFGILAGSSLALCGGAMQGIFRNPLADPYLLGIAAGASTGASLGITLGWESPMVIAMCAFFGGLLAVAIVYRIARTRWGKLSNVTLILAGVAVGAMFSAFTSFFKYFTGREEREQIIFWLMGDLGNGTWSQLASISIFCIIGSIAILAYSKQLNALSLGDDVAFHLGLSPQKTKQWLLVWSTLLTSGIVAVCGSIGFVGLIIPHIVRLLVGPDHRTLLPLSAVMGAAFLLACDLFARCIAPPNVIPIGLMTSVFGAPFFLYLLQKQDIK
ncbi:MAG: hypothetical protein CL920_30170 [Deltaproteobacteria bacterium]|nr:hypothetical protein [Deltaproteobacteria bacterium]MBU52979.1 hypothetical protein [Deltaproteobacteria bacterium]